MFLLCGLQKCVYSWLHPLGKLQFFLWHVFIYSLNQCSLRGFCLPSLKDSSPIKQDRSPQGAYCLGGEGNSKSTTIAEMVAVNLLHVCVITVAKGRVLLEEWQIKPESWAGITNTICVLKLWSLDFILIAIGNESVLSRGKRWLNLGLESTFCLHCSVEDESRRKLDILETRRLA